MKKNLAAIFIVVFTLVAAAHAKDIRRAMSEKTMTTVSPTAKSYVMASYSSATGWDLRRMATDSVLKVGGIDTTGANGTHYVKPYNTTAFSGTPEEGMLQTTPTGLQIYLNGAWRTVALVP